MVVGELIQLLKEADEDAEVVDNRLRPLLVLFAVNREKGTATIIRAKEVADEERRRNS